jgi:hypothetical protein
MKKTTKYFKQILSAVAVSAMLAGCNLLGLDMQQPYQYDYEIGMFSNETKMTAWEFIQSRTDLFSLLIEGIHYAGIEDNFKQKDCTYLLLTNTALISTSSTDFSYFRMHQLADPTIPGATVVPESLTQYTVEQVKELLLYHTVKGAYTWSNLPSSPTWYDTFATADTAKVNMYLLKDRNPNILFNNFTGHYKTSITARTTNLKTSDGSYMHILESWLDRPTRNQMK